MVNRIRIVLPREMKGKGGAISGKYTWVTTIRACRLYLVFLVYTNLGGLPSSVLVNNNNKNKTLFTAGVCPVFSPGFCFCEIGNSFVHIVKI